MQALSDFGVTDAFALPGCDAAYIGSLFTDISEQPIEPIFQGHIRRVDPQDGTYMRS